MANGWGLCVMMSTLMQFGYNAWGDAVKKGADATNFPKCKAGAACYSTSFAISVALLLCALGVLLVWGRRGPNDKKTASGDEDATTELTDISAKK